MKMHILCGVLLAAGAALAGGVSSRTVSAYLDNGDMPAARVVDANGTVTVVLAGEWFGSGACELLVDGVPVAASGGAAQTYALPGVDGTWRTYRVALKSAEGEVERLVTLYPSADFTCTMHHLSVKNCFLESSPAGTLRKVPFAMAVPVAWSGLWSEGADMAVVTLYAGRGTGGVRLAELVNSEGNGEGTYALGSPAAPLHSGHYTLTHFDGVETLTAYLRVSSGGTIFTLR